MRDQDIGNRDTVQGLGGIGSYLDSFAAHLAGCGYASTTVRSQLKLLGHFNEWLIRRRCDLHQLNDELVATFVNSRTRLGRVHRGDATTVHQFLTYLRARGELPPRAPVVDESPLGQLQRDYKQYLT